MTLALGAGGQQEGAHAGGKADAQRGHVGLDELHGVEDAQTRRDGAAGGIDVEMDVLVRVLAFQIQHLGHGQVGGLVHHRAHQEHHALTQQARVDVVGTLAPTALLDDDGHHAQALGSLCDGLRGEGIGGLRQVQVDLILDQAVEGHECFLDGGAEMQTGRDVTDRSCTTHMGMLRRAARWRAPKEPCRPCHPAGPLGAQLDRCRWRQEGPIRPDPSSARRSRPRGR